MSENKMKTLLKKLGTGDEKAFVSLYGQYAGKCFRFISSLVRDDAVAKDLTHDIFVKVWIKRSVVAEADSFDSYLFRMARNAVMDHFYNRDINRRFIAREMLLQDGLVPETEERVDETELQLLIYRTVAAMPEQRRRIFQMSRYYGIPNRKIAEVLSLNIRTVENHISAALRDIRFALAAQN